MALTRKFLKALGIEDEKVDQIIEAHTETVNGLKESLEQVQADAKALPGIQKELDTAKAALEAAKQDGWKDKHDKIKKEFDEYKAGITARETKAAKESAARSYYQGKGIIGKALEVAMRGSGAEIDALELGEDGKIKDTKALDSLVSGDFSGLVSTIAIHGASTATPPANTGGSISRSEIYKKDDKGRYVMSTAERQKAIAESMAKNE